VKTKIAILAAILVAHALAADPASDAERKKIAASIQKAVNIPAPSMEMFMRALDISPDHMPFERCLVSKEGLLINIKGPGMVCRFFPDGNNTVTLVDETPGNAYTIYWNIITNANGTLSVHGDDGKAIRDGYGRGEEVISMGSNHLKLDVVTDDLRILKSVQRLTELYRQHFPRNN